MKSDYFLMKEIKEQNKTENYEILYKRYLPMIKKHAYELHYLDNNIKKDYEQDAYFELIKAVKSIKLDKITYDHDGWKFLGQLWYFLKNLSRRYRKHIIKSYYKDIDFLEDSYTIIDKNILYNERWYSEYEEVREKIYLGDKFNSDQMEILRLRMRGLNISEIQKIFGKSYGWVHLQLYRIEKTLKKDFNCSNDILIKHVRDRYR